MWRATVLTIFPEMFPGPLGLSLAGKALEKGVWALDAIDIRDHTTDKHRTVDDTPAGGGPGMVMKADVLARAIDAAGEGRPRLLMSPRGAPLTQGGVAKLASGPGTIIVCGGVVGVDGHGSWARTLAEVSLGDFVLSGGEIAALALLDTCVRLLPGVMGKEASGTEESFAEGLLEYPHYTRPQLFEGRAIPEVLVSGDHAKVAAWRRAEAEALTRSRRPDLWAKAQQKPPKDTTKGGQARLDALYGRPIRSQRRIDGRSRSPRKAGRAADGDFNEPHSAARKRAVRQARRRQRNPGFRARRHRDRQREGGRRRPHPRAGL